MSPERDDAVRQVSYLLRGGAETMHLLSTMPMPIASEWQALDLTLRNTAGLTNDDPHAHDARLLLWLKGLKIESLEADRARQSLLDRALSCGLRNNSFEFVLGQCERLGFGADIGNLDPKDRAHELDLRMKHVRLLKRRGAFAEALRVLGTIAASVGSGGNPSSGTDLDVGALLYSVAKSLGSHQNRTGQSESLCVAVERRVVSALRRSGVTRQQFFSNTVAGAASPIAWRAEQLWARVVDYRSRQHLALFSEDHAKGRETKSALLRQWDGVIALEERLGIRSGRSHFARQAAVFTLSESAEERLTAIRRFEKLLLELMTGLTPDQRGVAIRALQLAQMCLDLRMFGPSFEYAELATESAESACDWPMMARSMLLKSSLVVASQQGGAARWGEAQYLAQRASDSVAKLQEPPLSLLFDNCVGEARIALSLGDHAMAREKIGQAIEYVRRMRDDLMREDWSGTRDDVPSWLLSISKLLSARQRATMQDRLATDWQRLLRSQDALVEMLRSAHELENYVGVVAVSAAREHLVRSALAHDVANVVGRSMAALVVEKGVLIEGRKVVPAADITHTQQQVEEAIRAHVLSGHGELSPAGMPGRFVSMAQLVAIDQRQLELLRTFANKLPMPVVEAAEDFELRCDEKLFRILFFQFLLNAAQELVSVRAPRIDVAVSWSQEQSAGCVEVSDNAGRVSQLRGAVERIQDAGTESDSGRGWGMREALRFFGEAWRCPHPCVLGQEGVRTTLQLRFPVGRGVNRLAAPQPLPRS